MGRQISRSVLYEALKSHDLVVRVEELLREVSPTLESDIATINSSITALQALVDVLITQVTSIDVQVDVIQIALDALQVAFDTLQASLGTMSGQNANSVAITGGSVQNVILSSVGGATLIKAESSLADNSGGSVGTLTNSPVVGNPTKWIAINDAGVIRMVPTW